METRGRYISPVAAFVQGVRTGTGVSAKSLSRSMIGGLRTPWLCFFDPCHAPGAGYPIPPRSRVASAAPNASPVLAPVLASQARHSQHHPKTGRLHDADGTPSLRNRSWSTGFRGRKEKSRYHREYCNHSHLGSRRRPRLRWPLGSRPPGRGVRHRIWSARRCGRASGQARHQPGPLAVRVNRIRRGARFHGPA